MDHSPLANHQWPGLLTSIFSLEKIDGQPKGGKLLFQVDNERRKKEIEQTRSGMRGKKKQDEKEKKGRPWTMDGRQLGKKKEDLMN